MIDLYSSPTPNGRKITIMLEELGVEYNPIFIDLDQLAKYPKKTNKDTKHKAKGQMNLFVLSERLAAEKTINTKRIAMIPNSAKIIIFS